MDYYINLISKRIHGSNLISKTRIQSPIKPSKDIFEDWKLETIDSFVKGIHHQPMVINMTVEEFVSLVLKLYKKIGKRIEQQDDSLTFKISTKQGSFYEEIDHLWLYSPEYKANIAVIKTK